MVFGELVTLKTPTLHAGSITGLAL